MGQLDPPRIHPSAGVPRASQPLETLYDTYHCVFTLPDGTVDIDHVKIARNPMRSAADQRLAAMHSIYFKHGVPLKKISAVRV